LVQWYNAKRQLELTQPPILTCSPSLDRDKPQVY